MPKGVKKTNTGYMGNPDLPSKGTVYEYTAEMVSEIQKCKEDILYFAENYFYILNIDEGKKKIGLYNAQKRILDQLIDNRFFVLLASRQTGKTTTMTIYILWTLLFFNDQRILLVANKEDTAIEIFSRVRMAYEMMPNWIKSPVVEYGKTSMVLENGSQASISTTTGTAARGKAVSVLIIDEVAFIEPHLMDPFWASVFPIVSSSKKAKVFMCSTPNGTGNLFYDIYTGALDKKNGWAHDKFLWSEVPGRDEEWVRITKGGLASEQKWSQEFECNFLNAGTSSLSEDLYDNMRKQIKEPVETLMDGKYKLYEYPNPERLYGAGVDVSEGVGGDYSVLKMYDFTDLNEIIEVAEFHDNQTPVSEFANIVYEILGHWGRPPVCVERNNQGGQVADRLGKDLGYDKVVCWGGKLAGRKNLELFGMISSRNTKIQACANARYFYSDKQALVIRDEDSLEELFKHFVKQNNDSWAAVSGKHDDRTMAMIWAMMLLHSDVCEDYFTIEEIDTCGKISKIGPLEFGETFQNATSIYTNEQVDKIEHSQLAPVGFNMFGASDISEINQLMADGWQFAGGSAPYDDPDKNISQDMWSTIDKYFG